MPHNIHAYHETGGLLVLEPWAQKAPEPGIFDLSHLVHILNDDVHSFTSYSLCEESRTGSSKSWTAQYTLRQLAPSSFSVLGRRFVKNNGRECVIAYAQISHHGGVLPPTDFCESLELKLINPLLVGDELLPAGAKVVAAGYSTNGGVTVERHDHFNASAIGYIDFLKELPTAYLLDERTENPVLKERKAI